MKKLLLLLASTCFLFSVAIPVLAQSEGENAIDIGNPITGFQPANNTTTTGYAFVQSRLGNLLNLMLRGIAVLSILPIVWGGVMMITSQGNSDQVEKGKSALYWGIVGLTLSFMAILLYSLLLRVLLASA